MFKRGIKVIYHSYIWTGEKGGFHFALELSESVKVVGEGYVDQETRDKEAKKICEELGLIMTI